jgi:hypothetical protein
LPIASPLPTRGAEPQPEYVALTLEVDPDRNIDRPVRTGLPDLDTLGAIKHYRGEIESEEPIPFGVQARVAEPGVVQVGDSISVE